MKAESAAQYSAKYGQLRVAVLTAGPSTGALGGAERLYAGLLDGLQEIGCRAERVAVPAEERSFEEIEGNYDRCSQLDLSAYDVVISTKAPTFAADHPRHVMYLVHTVRVFDDMFHEAFPDAAPEKYVARSRLHAMDFRAMSRIKAKFAIGHEVAHRLYRWRGFRAEVLHPPLGIQGLRQGPLGDYFFLPGRLHRWKRVDLAIAAVRSSSLQHRLVIAGTGEAETYLQRLAAGDPRIEFAGRIDDDELIDLYANALAVPFVPLREDFGYVALEAFACGKMVVTCADSGEPTRLVRNGETGLVCAPSPESLRAALDWVSTHRDAARQLGQNGAAMVAGRSWAKVASRLVDAALASDVARVTKAAKVTVLDMQPIDPPVGGGRLRLLGLYHNLGEGADCRYVGSYDWPGERYRKHRLSVGLEEVTVPLSDEHHAAARVLSSRAGGKTVIDISFGRLGGLSKDYLAAARRSLRDADVVVFSHPWIYPLVAQDLAPNQLVIYDSQNVEGYLRAQLLDEKNPVEAELLRGVVLDEYQLGCRADLILACSHEDVVRFHRIYGFPADKMRVAPNGVMAFRNDPPDQKEKSSAKKELNLGQDRLVAIFIGSAYGPNVEAGQFIVNHLAAALPAVTFVVAGGVGVQLSSNKANVIITGTLDEKEKQLWLSAADIAVNPMVSGSGTNIKMFDFMAMSLPIVTTVVGARGIEVGGRHAMLVVQPTAGAFADAILQLRDERRRQQLGEEARICIEEGYAWEHISDLTGSTLVARHRMFGQSKPFFSVVIPTYERRRELESLVGFLQKQIERDFEVVVVDQSESRWSGAGNDYGFPLTYFHSPVKGVVRARNAGAMLAQGKVIAFTDDDCQPAETWMFNARRYLGDEGVVGIEGVIISDHHNDIEWRPVSNVGFEGVGFMTANLMVRSGLFQLTGGFDLQFDHPHFREDTDFGWRLLEYGRVPYANDVSVFHPAQPRSIERESASSRAQFFQKDALLYKKHPELYRKLFFTECHFAITPGFTENVRRGFEIHGVPVPDWLEECLVNSADSTTKASRSSVYVEE